MMLMLASAMAGQKSLRRIASWGASASKKTKESLGFPKGTPHAAMLSNLDAKMLEQVMFPIAAGVLASLLCLWRNHRNMKSNHRAVRREIAHQFAIKPSRSVTEHSKGHGHMEVWTLGAMAVPEYLAKWSAIEQILVVKTELWRSGKEEFPPFSAFATQQGPRPCGRVEVRTCAQ
jgi:hypothetical protein